MPHFMMGKLCCCAPDSAYNSCEDVDAAISHFQGRLHSLIARRNALAPINSRLPKEILCEIFLQLASECFFGTSQSSPRVPHHHPSLDALDEDSLTSDTKGAAATRIDYTPRYAWLAITHVCRYWRDIARGFPNLWSLIDILPNWNHEPVYVDELLRLSKQAPLTIQHGYSSQHLVSQVESVLDEMYRIQDLKIFVQNANIWSRLEKSVFNAPLLERLHVMINHMTANDTWYMEYTANVPKLRELSLCLTSPAMLQALASSTLVKLHVDFPLPPSGSLTDLLLRLPLLEELHLQEVFASTSDQAASTMIPLPRLRSLRLSHYLGWEASANLLASLVVPSTVKIHFIGEASVEYFDDYESVYRSIASIISDNSLAPSQQPVACHAQDTDRVLTLSMWSQEISMPELDAFETESGVEGQVTIVWRGRHTGVAFHALLVYFPLPKLRLLHLDNVSTYDDTWWTLAQAQDLREIKIGPHDIAVELVTALQSSPPPPNELPDGHPPFSSHLFPNLEALTLRSVKWNTHTYSAERVQPVVLDVEAMLTSRHSHGVPLKRLYLENGINTHTDEMDRLRDSGGLARFLWDSKGGIDYETSCDDCNTK